MQMYYECVGKVPPGRYANPLSTGIQLIIWSAQIEDDPQRLMSLEAKMCHQQLERAKESMTPLELAIVRRVSSEVWLRRILRDETRRESIEFTNCTNQKSEINAFIREHQLDSKHVERVIGSIPPESLYTDLCRTEYALPIGAVVELLPLGSITDEPLSAKLSLAA